MHSNFQNIKFEQGVNGESAPFSQIMQVDLLYGVKDVTTTQL
jgi:hypothetical protein